MNQAKGGSWVMVGAAVLAVVATALVSGRGNAELPGGAHDLRDELGVTDVCAPCHSEHSPPPPEPPLWDHTLTTQTFLPYSDANGTLDAAVAQPGIASIRCLSCHDGTVSVDAYGGAAGDPATMIDNVAIWGPEAPRRLIDPNLGLSHPIGLEYTSALATVDGELADPVVAASGLGGTIQTDMLLTNEAAQQVRLECPSCHDIHESTLPSELIMPASQLCTTCHLK